MYSISQDMGNILANDTKATLSQMEEALLRNAAQLTSTIEVMRSLTLPIGVKRKLYGSLTASAAKIVEAQQEQDQAIRLLHLINKHNATPVEMFGCPIGWPIGHDRSVAGDAVEDLSTTLA